MAALKLGLQGPDRIDPLTALLTFKCSKIVVILVERHL